ncbi:transposase [Nocardiopsis sp. Huas11]|uniref:IS630 family transposase n=1 Tax=Nocardiopsis sp. Huas11 TaxID=2183912 RepID=UPI000EB2D1A3|nr:IS630 family transposase [Nocardiopsis sp. Huas11]RKS07451.1 transposase [Nocardiopsis sp. Huas11]RKS07919.1 transposase [Nocardiopsis sp. Huas11]
MAQRGRKKRLLVVSDEDRRTLEQIARRPTSAQVMAQRARIILRCAEGGTDAEVARVLGVWPQTVGKWRNRYIDGGLEALSDKDRPGQPRKITDAHVEEVIRQTLEQPSPDGGTHWSTRSMAERTGLNQTAVSRIWRAFGLKPHLVDEWKLSNDPFFIEKVRDVTGLYLNPPDAALVLCVDEKSQIQALNRSAPVLPMMPAVPERQTHDYIRHGTTTLFAALDAASGKVISAHHRRHRSVEFRKFLNQIDRETPPGLDVHLIVDNYGTHKAPIVKDWLLAHPRFHLHFIPTYSSWLNLVERFFAEITRRMIRRGSYTSVSDLEHALQGWIDTWNENPRPFVWTKTAEEIFETIAAYLHRINDSEH